MERYITQTYSKRGRAKPLLKKIEINRKIFHRFFNKAAFACPLSIIAFFLIKHSERKLTGTLG